MKALLDGGYLHGDCLTVTGRTVAENLASVKWNNEQDVVYPTSRPLTATGGVVGLKGNLAPEGAIVKVAGMPADKQVFTGPARCFDNEEACFEAVTNRRYKEGDVLVIRYEGPKGGPACARCWRRPRPSTDRAWATRWPHHGRPLLRRHARLLRWPRRPEAAVGGPIGLIQDGDIIELDAINGKLQVRLTDAELAARKAHWKPGKRNTAPARSGSSRRASVPRRMVRSRIRAVKVKSSAMRTSERATICAAQAVLATCLALQPAGAFETRSSTVEPRASAPATALSALPALPTPSAPDLGVDGALREIWRGFARSYKSGDKQAALKQLEAGVSRGDILAQWKLGRMYAMATACRRMITRRSCCSRRSRMPAATKAAIRCMPASSPKPSWRSAPIGWTVFRKAGQGQPGPCRKGLQLRRHLLRPPRGAVPAGADAARWRHRPGRTASRFALAESCGREGPCAGAGGPRPDAAARRVDAAPAAARAHVAPHRPRECQPGARRLGCRAASQGFRGCVGASRLRAQAERYLRAAERR